MTEKEFDFPVGKIVGLLGLKGKVKVRPSTNNPDLLLGIKDVEIYLEEFTRVAKVKEIKLEKRLLIMSFEGYSDRTSVEPIEGAELRTFKDQLQNLDSDEWWVHDLVGLPVFTTNGDKVGTIESIVDAGTQLLEITMDDKSLGSKLVPFVKELVPVVDIRAGRVEIATVPGLLD
ncbi:MAG: ribosome maturation factor RimM [Cyanobacteria bacterium]|nr:ribosome maturation factor RimM [Cyanobacteriota bacterium]